MFDFDSGVSSVYVSSLFPGISEDVRLRIFVSPAIDVVYGHLMVVHDDTVSCIGLSRNGSFMEAVARTDSKPLRWWFEIRYHSKASAEDEVVYYAKDGLQTEVPVWEQCFKLVTGMSSPSWVSSCTCYQIFPDRFCKGDPSLGVKDGDYSYDGAPCRAMKWTDKPLDFQEGRCLDFFNGDFAGIEQRIPYLKKLGISCIYLNPIGCSMTTHRYDCTDYNHIDPKLGGDDGYAHLCHALHENGIRVITDISINHTGTENLWFKSAMAGGMEKDYYFIGGDGKAACWNDVPTLPQLNYNSAKLRDAVYRNEDSVMKKFLKAPYYQDGWRLDVADSVGVRPDQNLCKEVWTEVNANLKKTNPAMYLVAEDWQDPSAFFNGRMWDAAMNYLGCSRPLRRWAGEMDRFQLPAWGHMPEKTRPYSASELRRALELQLSSIPGQFQYLQFNLIDSHDTPRFHSDELVFDEDIYLGMLCAMYMLPGMPSLYYGDEILLEGPVGTVESSRYPMDWNPKRQECRTFRTLEKLGRLRAVHSEVLSGGQTRFFTISDDILGMARYNEEEALVLILSRSCKPSEIALDFFASEKQYTDFFSGQSFVSRLSLAPKQSTVLIVQRPLE